jgi:hypothetical protein
MKQAITLIVSALCLPMVLYAQSPASDTSTSTAAVNKELWSIISESVVHADIAAMSRTYHAEAVFVGATVIAPIKTALAHWRKDMDVAKVRGDKATVEFRFASRQDGTTTAFETGIFKYTVTERNGKVTSAYIPFECLLTRSTGKWRTLMERQLAAVTVDEWNRLKQ